MHSDTLQECVTKATGLLQQVFKGYRNVTLSVPVSVCLCLHAHYNDTEISLVF